MLAAAGASAVLAAAGTLAQTVAASEVASIVQTGGAIGTLALLTWGWLTGRIARGADLTRLIDERDAAHERERDLHRVIQTEIIPIVVAVQTQARETATLLRVAGVGGPDEDPAA